MIDRGAHARRFDLIDRGAHARRVDLTLREAGLYHYISRTFQAGIRGSANRLDKGGWISSLTQPKYFMLALEAQLTDLLLGAGS